VPRELQLNFVRYPLRVIYSLRRLAKNLVHCWWQTTPFLNTQRDLQTAKSRFSFKILDIRYKTVTSATRTHYNFEYDERYI